MDSIVKRIVNVGTNDTMPKLRARAIVMANTIALISAGLCFIVLLYFLRNGWSWIDSVIFIAVSCLCCVPLLNRLGAVNASRFILAVTMPAASVVMALVPRVLNPDRFDYTRSAGLYSIILATSVISVLVFSSRERKLMLVTHSLNFITFASLDIILRVFSKVHTLPTLQEYLSANIILFSAYWLLTGSVFSLKNIMDEYEVRNELLISRLNEKNRELENSNRELYELNKNIETQNEEIQAQSEELIQSQESLVLAHNEIERQRYELEIHNKFLAKSLDEKNRDLLYSNQQLISQNNELQQFSYTVSHNLRGPVASMLGLVKIHALAKTPAEEKQILALIERSAQSLETIIWDLNKIIDIRNDKFSAFEMVSLDQELMLICQSLNAFIQKNDVQIEQHFNLREIISIKAYVNSILYNLVSNSIQYRSHDRQPRISISSTAENGNAVLEVTDNGMGIDLQRYQPDLFKLYKRFHTHTQGKGLGLYLVKQQVDKLNGHIEVESKPDTGTTFRVVLPVR